MSATLTRRDFTKRVLVAAALPVVTPTLQEQEPATIAGYKPTAEEAKLAAAFTAAHEKNMQPLRERELPIALAPSFVFKAANTPKRSSQ